MTSAMLLFPVLASATLILVVPGPRSVDSRLAILADGPYSRYALAAQDDEGDPCDGCTAEPVDDEVTSGGVEERSRAQGCAFNATLDVYDGGCTLQVPQGGPPLRCLPAPGTNGCTFVATWVVTDSSGNGAVHDDRPYPGCYWSTTIPAAPPTPAYEIIANSHEWNAGCGGEISYLDVRFFNQAQQGNCLTGQLILHLVFAGKCNICPGMVE